jgi:hypothetical protein
MLLVSELWLATNRRWAGPVWCPARRVLCPAPEPGGPDLGPASLPAAAPCVTLTDVSETASCPHCGAAVPDGGAPGGAAAHPGTGERDLGSLYQEIRRIREIAEARDAGEGSRRVAELTREVAELRATVARLRGTAMGAAIRA